MDRSVFSALRRKTSEWRKLVKILRSGWVQVVILIVSMFCSFMSGKYPGSPWVLGSVALLLFVFMAALDVVRDISHPSLWGIFFAAGVVLSSARDLGQDLDWLILFLWVCSLYLFVYMWLRYFRPHTNRAFEVTEG